MHRRSFISAIFGLPAIHASKPSLSSGADKSSHVPEIQVRATDAGFVVAFRGGDELEVTKRGWGHPRHVLQSGEAPPLRPA